MRLFAFLQHRVVVVTLMCLPMVETRKIFLRHSSCASLSCSCSSSSSYFGSLKMRNWFQKIRKIDISVITDLPYLDGLLFLQSKQNCGIFRLFHNFAEFRPSLRNLTFVFCSYCCVLTVSGTRFHCWTLCIPGLSCTPGRP